MRQAVGYVRVSTDLQEHHLQLVAIQKAVTNDGLALAAGAVYEDTASGWRDVRRPGLDRLLRDADGGRLRGSVLYIFALSRLSRKGTRDVLQTLDRLALGGVAVKSATESYVNTTDANPFRDVILSLFATVAKLESQAKSDRMKSWAAVKRQRGERMGRHPTVVPADLLRQIHAGTLSIGAAARSLGVSRNTVKKALGNYRRENQSGKAV